MDIIEIQATQETSKSEAQDTKESSGKEEAVTPIYNRFQSLDDSDALLELDTEHQPQVQAREQEIYQMANDKALESNLQEHILEDSTMSNKNPRRALWEELKRLSLNKVPWTVGGDFNTMLHTHENQGGTISSLGSIEDFNDMVLDSGFTWTNKRVWRRLDRVLYSQEWAELFNSTRVSHLLRRLLQQKLYRLKNHLKQWNKDCFGNIFSLVDQAKAAANEIEKHFNRLLSEANLTNLNKHNATLVHALKLESEFWRQKSNCKWLEAGERNTKFFHASVKKKRLKSRISRVMDNQHEITDSAQIKDSAVHFFESLLSDNPATSLPHDFPFQFPQIHQDVLLNLCQRPSQDDIKEVVFSINKDSVAGPDGFSSAFFQACWNTIAEDVNAAVMDFFRGTPMPRSFSATSIILIPKNDSPQSPGPSSDLSPSAMLPIRSCPSFFILKSPKLSLTSFPHLRVALCLAYDRVNWKFLYVILEKMGFPFRFIILIKHAIEHCWFTILVNGEPSGFFKSSQGLRQGDPISPALFILATEALSRGLNHLFSQNPGMFYQMGYKARVSHLAYADDIIIFTRCEEHSLTKLMQFLELYEDQSGQKINHSKSFIIPGKKANNVAHRIKSITGFNLKCLPITYLGAPLHKGKFIGLNGLSYAILVKKGAWVSETLGIPSQPLPTNSGGG
ncbi:UNVERIFIED_CONTAM: hypothetical protein Sindi_2687500 [Sesamum indicum]